MNVKDLVEKGKAIVAFLGAIWAGVQSYVNDGVITNAEWFLIASVVVTAIGVYLVPNGIVINGAAQNVVKVAKEARAKLTRSDGNTLF